MFFIKSLVAGFEPEPSDVRNERSERRQLLHDFKFQIDFTDSEINF